VYGVLSLIFWSLIVVVTLKYVLILLRADNNGEGGTLALTALAFRALGKRTPLVLGLGIVGASMFYGSTLITPALSVLSAVEGLTVATPAFGPYVLPLTVVILIALFSVQSRGTASISALFAPITTIWFIVIAIAGAVEIADNPSVLAALNPIYGIHFLLTHGIIGLITLGAVFLVVTGSEALYNDLGHFGRKPIQTAWLYLVLPALLLNYFGQGALVLDRPETLSNPFYLLYPDWALYPMVALATAATAIASQAVITGAYSITRQAMQLGFLPRMEVRHTSEALAGQIYMPRVNWLLLTGVLLLVFMFRSSSELAAAYVLAVATTEWTAGALGLHRHLEAVALAALGRRGRHDPAAPGGHGLCAGQHSKVVPGGLAAGPGRRSADPDHGHLAARHADAREEDAARRSPLPGPGRQPREEAAARRSRHGRVPHQRSGFRADRVAAQSQAQQGAARAQCDPHDQERGHSARAARRAGGDDLGQQEIHAARAALRLHGAAQRAEGRWAWRASMAGNSTSCRRRSSCRAARSGPTRARACRPGRTSSTSSSRIMPTTRRATSNSPPTAWWKSAPKSRCEVPTAFSGKELDRR
jgi:hypothetical protein